MKSRLPQEYMNKYRLKNKTIKPQLTLYDLNKQMINQMSEMSEAVEQQHIKDVFEPFIESTNNQYYMLMCREFNYFTLFHKVENNKDKIYDTLKELLTEHGTLITADWANSETKNSIEYWIKINTPIENNPDFSEVYCFMLFPYDEGVVEVC